MKKILAFLLLPLIRRLPKPKVFTDPASEEFYHEHGLYLFEGDKLFINGVEAK